MMLGNDDIYVRRNFTKALDDFCPKQGVFTITFEIDRSKLGFLLLKLFECLYRSKIVVLQRKIMQKCGKGEFLISGIRSPVQLASQGTREIGEEHAMR